MSIKDAKLHMCSICGVHEPLHTLTDGVCIECIKDGRTKTPYTRKRTLKSQYQQLTFSGVLPFRSQWDFMLFSNSRSFGVLHFF